MLRGVILDLDGSVYLGEEAVPGAAVFVQRARKGGLRVRFVTNRANRTAVEVRAQLTRLGMPCDAQDVVTSAEATAQFIGRGRAFVIGEEGLREALTRQGIVLTDQSPDYVVVSFDRGFNYEQLTRACRLIHAGATFVATNPDRALKTETGLVPGTGAIVAAVAAGCGVDPLMIGKPERRIMDMAIAGMGLTPDQVLVVGDNVATDVPAGAAAGARTVLLLTGVSTREDLARAAVQPDWVARDYDDLWRIVTANSSVSGGTDGPGRSAQGSTAG
jgi:4-nitrophenyl phosphatase